MNDAVTFDRSAATAVAAKPVATLPHDAFQCGYCTPGQICSRRAHQRGDAKDRQDMREQMSWGRRDRLCLPRQAARAQAAFSAAELHWSEGSGHSPLWGTPVKAVAVILDAVR